MEITSPQYGIGSSHQRRFHMSNAIVQSEPKKMGRPTVITEEVSKKLEDVLRLGVNDSAACSYAGISRETFYNHVKDDDDFCDRMDNARNYAVIAARQVVVKSIVEDKNLDSSKWYVEKHDIKQVGTQQNTQVNVFAMLKDKYTIKDPEVKTETIVNGEKVNDGQAGLSKDN
jgi:hypothetical protein